MLTFIGTFFTIHTFSHTTTHTGLPHTRTQDKDGLVLADSLKPVLLTQMHGAAHEYVPADTHSIPYTIMDHSNSKPRALCLCLLKL